MLAGLLAVVLVAGQSLGAVITAQQCRSLCETITSPDVLRKHHCLCSNDLNLASYELQLRQKRIGEEDDDFSEPDEAYPDQGISFLDYPLYVPNMKSSQNADVGDSNDRMGRLRDNGWPKLPRPRKSNKSYGVKFSQRIKHNRSIDGIHANHKIETENVTVDNIDPIFIKDLEELNINVTDFIKCIDLHVLLHIIQNDTAADNLKDIWKFERFTSYKNIPRDRLLSEIKIRCANAEKTVKSLVEDIKMSLPNKTCPKNVLTTTTDKVPYTTTDSTSTLKIIMEPDANVREEKHPEDFVEPTKLINIIYDQALSPIHAKPKIKLEVTTQFDDNITQVISDKSNDIANISNHSVIVSNSKAIRINSSETVISNNITSSTVPPVITTVFINNDNTSSKKENNNESTNQAYTDDARESSTSRHIYINKNENYYSLNITIEDTTVESEITNDLNPKSTNNLLIKNRTETSVDVNTSYTIAEISAGVNNEPNKYENTNTPPNSIIQISDANLTTEEFKETPIELLLHNSKILHKDPNTTTDTYADVAITVINTEQTEMPDNRKTVVTTEHHEIRDVKRNSTSIFDIHENHRYRDSNDSIKMSNVVTSFENINNVVESSTNSNGIAIINDTNADQEEREREKSLTILTREFPNNTVISTTDTALYGDRSYSTQNKIELNPAREISHVEENSLINGSLFLLWNENLLPSHFVQTPDGNIHVGINAMSLCDELTIRNTTALIKLICRYVNENTRMNTK